MSKRHKKHLRPDDAESNAVEETVGDKGGLKLVLKVGLSNQLNRSLKTADDDASDTDWQIRQKRKKHHQDKAKSLSDDSDEESEDNASDVAAAAAAGRTTTDDDPNRRRQLREKKFTDDELTPLLQLLDYLQKILQRKDVNGFFSYPVTDSIAPGYFSVISSPMDFSTMKTKIDSGIYQSVQQYKTDFELMIHNCLAYNHPETIYHKEAKRLLATGQKLLSREKLNHFRRNLTWLVGVSDADLGIDDVASDSHMSLHEYRSVRKHNVKAKTRYASCGVGQFEAVPDNLTPDELLKQAREAAQFAAETLTLRKPNSKIGFLRRRSDGSTSFNILNPENTGKVSETERVVSLGSLVGKITSGTGVLAGIKEDKRNNASCVNYLNYGSYCSYAPSFDSSQANVSKEYSDLLISTYGDEIGVDYADSLQKFVENSGDYAIKMVDNLLDILTAGEHSKAKAASQEEQTSGDSDQKTEETSIDNQQQTSQQIATSSNTTSTDDVIITDINDSYDQSTWSGVQDQLDNTAKLINKLDDTQYQRLSQHLPSHLTYLQPPTSEELDIATSVSAELTQLIKQTQPADVVSSDSVHKIIGLSTEVDPDMFSEQDNCTVDCGTNDLDQDLHDFFQQTNNDDNLSSARFDLTEIEALNDM